MCFFINCGLIRVYKKIHNSVLLICCIFNLFMLYVVYACSCFKYLHVFLNCNQYYIYVSILESLKVIKYYEYNINYYIDTIVNKIVFGNIIIILTFILFLLKISSKAIIWS